LLKRKLSEQLLDWKNAPDKMSLIVQGARQVGKTFTINEFAKRNYDNYIYINFEETPEHTAIFSGNLDAGTIYTNLTLRFRNVNIIPEKTLIFLDEIQKCPSAITALKFLTIDKKFDWIASGSLLGIGYKNVSSFPVGYVNRLEMHSLDFEEYLWAHGYDDEKISIIKENFVNNEPLSGGIHNVFMNLFKEYIVVGGMPKVVHDFITHRNYANVLTLQRAIIEDYKADISKYADEREKPKIRECFLSIPKQLAKENKKFQYGLVEKKGTASKFAGSLMWLHDAGITNFCYNLSQPELPLEGNSINSQFKLYMRDTGLLMAMLDDGAQADIIEGNLGIYKGAIYENIVADIFTKLGKKLYYFEYRNQIEMDFIIRYNEKATAVDVKSATNSKSKSMTNIIKNWGMEQGIQLSSKNIEGNDVVRNYPLYMSIFLR